MGSRAPGFQQLCHVASIVVALRLSYTAARGVFPGRGLNPCLLHWEAESSLSSHQESPRLRSCTTRSGIWASTISERPVSEPSITDRQVPDSLLCPKKSKPDILCALVLSRFGCVQLFATLWLVACQTPLSMRFSRQGYWSGEPTCQCLIYYLGSKTSKQNNCCFKCIASLAIKVTLSKSNF